MTNSSSTALGGDLHTWRDDAVARCIGSLVREVGCRFTIDDIAHRIGVARGSLFIDRSTAVDVIEETLDAWAERVVPAALGDGVEPFVAACWALLTTSGDADGERRPAIPCCLAASPCPHRWPARWGPVAARFGLGTSDVAALLGEALQAIAASDQVRALIFEGRTMEAVQHVLGYFESDVGDAWTG